MVMGGIVPVINVEGIKAGEIVLDGPPGVVFASANTSLLASTGLQPPPAARIAALMGLAGTPIDATELLQMLSA